MEQELADKRRDFETYLAKQGTPILNQTNKGKKHKLSSEKTMNCKKTLLKKC